MIPEWHYSGSQITGDRTRQEDAFCFMGLGAGGPPDPGGAPAPLLAIVSDGMGGYGGGDTASRLAIEAFTTEASLECGGSASEATAGAALPDSQIPPPLANAPTPWPAYFLRALARANAAIARENAGTRTTGCTIVCAIVDRNHLHWISVGDSSLLLYRNNTLTRLNADHSMRPITREKLARGEITEHAAAAQSNLLRSAIAGSAIDLIDMNASPAGHPLEEGDILLLASDGLETLPLPQLTTRLAKLRHCSAAAIARSLLNTIENQARPHQDNTTILCIKLDPPAKPAPTPTRRVTTKRIKN